MFSIIKILISKEKESLKKVPTEINEAESGKLLKKFEGTQVVRSVVISPDNQKIICSNGWSIYIWDIYSGKLLRSCEGHKNDVYCVAISSDNQIVVSGSCDKTIKLWEALSLKLLKTLEDPSKYTNNVHSVAISPDVQTIASGWFPSRMFSHVSRSCK